MTAPPVLSALSPELYMVFDSFDRAAAARSDRPSGRAEIYRCDWRLGGFRTCAPGAVLSASAMLKARDAVE